MKVHRFISGVCWYANRISVMGVQEILHRILEQLNITRLRGQQKFLSVSSPKYLDNFSFCQGDMPRLASLDWNKEIFDLTTKDFERDHLHALGFSWCFNGNDSWHKAPDTGHQWPLVFFSDLSYRVGNPSGDARVVWEPSRLQFLLTLALLAQRENNRALAVAQFENLFLSWVRANPPYKGVHYVSAMECGLRLIAVVHAVDLIKPFLSNPGEIWLAVLGLIKSHASLIIKRLSLYSSAGNHTLAEAAGLIYAGYLFPEFADAENWRETGLDLFIKESKRQFLEDGGSLEQAFGYHLLITDLVNLVRMLLKSKGESTEVLDEIAERAQNFLSCFWDDYYQLPNIGDWDNGFALSPYLSISKKHTSWAGKKCFPQSGYSVIKPAGSIKALWVMDHGPLGMAPSYGHGHSDCLSVYFRLGNIPILNDSGTYTYTGHPSWREYFRSARAHNVVTIDNNDQAVQQGAFMWERPFTCQVIETHIALSEWSVVLAYHTGYDDCGIRHYRALCVNEEGGSFVWDYLKPVKTDLPSMTASLWWHLGPENEVKAQSEGSYLIPGNPDTELEMKIVGGDSYLRKEEDNPKSGWFSPMYGQKIPVYTIESRHTGNFPHEFCTYVDTSSNKINNNKNTFDLLKNKLREYCDAAPNPH